MMQVMNNPRRSDQPSLFPSTSNVPERFRLDDATRRRGLRHVARIRAELEARARSKSARSPDRAPRSAA
jgi:hypothetical protein